MLILLPPSEGKTTPRRGAPLRPTDWPESMRAPREAMLETLVELCQGDPTTAAAVLGLSLGQLAEVGLNARLRTAATARADRVYAGVLYEALGFATLEASARRRATGRVAVVSSLYGLVRPDERIAAYRLAGDVRLPGLGSVAGHWRAHLDPVVRSALGTGLLVDLRSSTYAAFWRPGADLAPRVATVRVLHESAGKRTVVSHFNKATKGRLVRALLEDGAAPHTPAALGNDLERLGWRVETGPSTTKGTRLDVVVADV